MEQNAIVDISSWISSTDTVDDNLRAGERAGTPA
jgi:hypothetical protein